MILKNDILECKYYGELIIFYINIKDLEMIENYFYPS